MAVTQSQSLKTGADGEFVKPEELEYKIQVTVDSNAKTISVEDNGIGMTAEEVEEYINQIAFSGPKDFLEKYKDKANEDQIISHFRPGLLFRIHGSRQSRYRHPVL